MIKNKVNLLKGKKIIIGVTGSIAAYKVAYLIRLLVNMKAEVKVMMTHSAKKFISPVTLATLSKNPVLTEFTKDDTGTWNDHTELALWADAILIAPAGANTLAHMAHGQCSNILLSVYLSAKSPVFIAPAMDLNMWIHPATQKNIELLKSYNNICIDPTHGELASGLVGIGRMAEPEKIIHHLERTFKKKTLSEDKSS